MALVVDDAELAWRHAVDRFSGMHHVLAVVDQFQPCWQKFGGVANLDGDISHTRGLTLCVVYGELSVDAVEVADGEMLPVGRGRVVAVGDVDDVLLDVFLHDKPRAATQSHTFALSNGVEPVSLVMAYNLASF